MSAITPVSRSAKALIMEADERRQQLAEAGDSEGLAASVADLEWLMRELRDILYAAKADIVAIEGDTTHRVMMAGGGMIEITRPGMARKNWDSKRLALTILRQHLDPEGTGEYKADSATVLGALEALFAALPLTGSLGWRATALRTLGLDPSAFCDETPTAAVVKVTPAPSPKPQPTKELNP